MSIDKDPTDIPGLATRRAATPSKKERETVPGKPVVVEIGGPTGPEPTRYGDWERGGRCTDF